MMKALLVPALAAGLAFGGGTKEAEALTAEETAALIAGLVIVGVVASNHGNNRAEAASRSAPLEARGKHDWRDRDDRHAGRGILPSDCLRRIDTNRGPRTLAGEACLERNGVRTSRLPETCEVTVRVGGRLRDAYGQRCLENAGYRFRDGDDRYDGRRVLDARR